MTATRILGTNAVATMLTAVTMLVGRRVLYPQYGLADPLMIDAIAVAFLVYAGAMALSASGQGVSRRALLVYAAADAAWVVASALMLALWWPQFTGAGRALIVVVALVVEVFATLQFRAAGAGRALRVA